MIVKTVNNWMLKNNINKSKLSKQTGYPLAMISRMLKDENPQKMPAKFLLKLAEIGAITTDKAVEVILNQ